MSLAVKTMSEDDNWRQQAFNNRMRYEAAEAERDALRAKIGRALAVIETPDEHPDDDAALDLVHCILLAPNTEQAR